ITSHFSNLYYPFFFQAEDGIRVFHVTGVQTCALPIWWTDCRATTGRRRQRERAPRPSRASVCVPPLCLARSRARRPWSEPSLTSIAECAECTAPKRIGHPNELCRNQLVVINGDGETSDDGEITRETRGHRNRPATARPHSTQQPRFSRRRPPPPCSGPAARSSVPPWLRRV